MMSHVTKYCRAYAALVLAAAGIGGVIDQATMIVLVVVLVVVPRRDCLAVAGKA